MTAFQQDPAQQQEHQQEQEQQHQQQPRQQQIRFQHDSGYKYLFSSKEIFCQLLNRFVDHPEFRSVTPDQLELFEHSFVSDTFSRRESDCIYKITLPPQGSSQSADRGQTSEQSQPTGDGKPTGDWKPAGDRKPSGRELYIYVLLEFQSTQDKSIPIRMLLYLLQFYDLLLRNSQRGKLPAVFPLLLYNGRVRWKVAGNVNELIEPMLPEPYIPSFTYYVIDERNISKERLKRVKGAAAAIMLSEQLKLKDRKQIDRALRDIVELLTEEQTEVKRMVLGWLMGVLLAPLGVGEQELEEMKERLKERLVEEPEMLVDVMAEILKKEREESEERGEERGIKVGTEKTSWELARRMHAKGFPVEEIAELTGLPVDQLRTNLR